MDKYTKVAKIGQGSFGCAYLVTRKNDALGKKYVIKEIRMDPRDQQSALREAKLLAALDHPNIIACKESFLLAPPAPLPAARFGARPPPQQQVFCIVTEFADGGDLRKRLERRDRLRESDILDLFVQVCLALKHLHDRKIIHRDIKPENIFLTRANVVKLGDFGVATVLSNTLASAATMTGTPYYTSPEICLGKRYNSKTDIWSLGCVLYELATFVHAFNGRSQRQLFDNIVNANVAPIPAAAATKRLAELVSEMLRKNPRERPSVNQIIKKPIVMERIQNFLSERAVADELNHTVLHGHHIFRKHQPVASVASVVSHLPPPPPSVVRAPAIVAKSVAKSPGANATPGSAARRAEAARVDRRKQLAAAAAAAPPPPKKKKVSAPAPAGGNRAKTPGVMLKSRSFKKNGAIARLPSPRRAVAAAANRAPAVGKQRIGGGIAAAAGAPRTSASPSTSSSSSLEQRKRASLLLQKKRTVVEKAKQDAQRARRVVPPPPFAAKAAQPAVKSVQVADRVSAFNEQWRAQRQQLLQNIQVPPPPPAAPSPPPAAPPALAGGNNNVNAAALPPPAPVSTDNKSSDVHQGAAAAVTDSMELQVNAYPKPIEVVAPPSADPVFVPPTMAGANARRRAAAPTSAVKTATAKQRDAMRRDIQSRKLQMKKAGSGGVAGVSGGSRDVSSAAVNAASPLDDPIILVQNLPDYGERRSRQAPAAASSSVGASDAMMVLPPPAPTSAAAGARVAGTGVDNGSTSQDLNDAVADASDDEAADGDVDDVEVAMMAPVNLEFERMVLQLKSVVESPDLDDLDEDDDDDLDEDKDSTNSAAACLPLPPAYTDTDNALTKPHGAVATLDVSTLEDPAFTKALRSLLAADGSDSTASAVLDTVPADQTPTLRWLHSYIASVAPLSSSSSQSPHQQQL